MDMALTVLVFALPILLAIWATLKVVRDDLSERGQKVAQLALVWLVPILGALCVLAVHRKAEKPSGKYRAGVDAGDDYADSGRGAKAMIDALDE